MILYTCIRMHICICIYPAGLFVPNDEAVIIFRVAAGGMAHLHNGQVRACVRVLACLHAGMLT
jgi:hypothetical protein